MQTHHSDPSKPAPQTLSAYILSPPVSAIRRHCLTEQLNVVLERLSLNSRNSSKPPSSDSPGGSGMNRAQRRASGRKRGAQKGHPGAWREMAPAEQVKDVHECPPPEQCECGGAVQQRGKPWRHQVFDIPPIQAQVTEYRLFSGRCAGCGKSHRAALPAGAREHRALLSHVLSAAELQATVGEDWAALMQTSGASRAAAGTAVDEALTSETASKLMHVSRTHVNSLADSGALGVVRRTGGGHRRISKAALLRYKALSKERQSKGLDAMVAASQKLGLYDAEVESQRRAAQAAGCVTPGGAGLAGADRAGRGVAADV